MSDIVALLHSLTPYLSKTTLRQMKHVIFAVLCIPDRVTMLSIARWTERGGSYRTVQCWYHTPLDWAAILWTVVQVYLLKPDGEYLLAGDEVVISKADDKTYGRGRFYSSLARRPINSVSFMAVSLIDVQARQCYLLQVEQRHPAMSVQDPVESLRKRNRGRPKGRKNHEKPTPKLTPDLTLLQYWGLDDFMTVKPIAVTNAVNLAFFMVTLSAVMLRPYRDRQPDFSVLDLKAQFRARRYLDEIIKMLPDPPDDDLVSRIWRRLSAFSAIRVRQSDRFAA